MPTLCKKPDGRYYIDWRDSDGRHRKPVHVLDVDGQERPCRDASAAKRAFKQFAAGFESTTPTIVTGPDPLLRDLVRHFLESYLPAKNAAARTSQKYDQVLDDFIRFASIHHVGRASQLTERTLDAYTASLRESGNGPKSIKGKLAIVRAMLKAAVERRLLDESPIRKWTMPKVPEPEISPLTTAQLRAVLEIIRRNEPAYYPIIAWIALTGCRPSDAIGLVWRQVDIEHGAVRRLQTKTKRLAVYQISREARSLLSGQARRPHRDSDAVFINPNTDSAFTFNPLYQHFTRALARAGFERAVTLKDLRHTFGSLLANGTPPCPLTELQVLMGHTNVLTTARYVHPQGGAAYVDGYAALLNESGKMGTKGHQRRKKPSK